MHKKFVSLIACLFLSACLNVSGSDRVIDSKQVVVPASGLTEIELDVAAGSLEVIGENGRSEVLIQAEFVADVRPGGEERLLKKLKFSHEVKGSRLLVKTETPTSFWGESGLINVTVTLPSTLSTVIDDSSGDITVRSVHAALDIDDSSGEIVLSDITGPLNIDDSSGDIEVLGLAGDATIDDSSGDILVKGGNNINIDDSSGDIDVVNVTGNVTIDDSSGDISVDDIGGDFTVQEDSAGKVNYKNVRGRVSIPE